MKTTLYLTEKVEHDYQTDYIKKELNQVEFIGLPVELLFRIMAFFSWSVWITATIGGFALLFFPMTTAGFISSVLLWVLVALFNLPCYLYCKNV